MLRRILECAGVYKLYEKWLRRQITNGNIPAHVGLILDGNRRWAAARNLKPWYGHKIGAKKVWDLIRWCRELGIKTLTIYAFSLDNFKRPQREVNEIFNIFREELQKLKNNDQVKRESIRIKFIGRLNLIPKDLQEAMKELEEVTKNNNSLTVNIAIAYGGKGEIVDAAKKIAEKVMKGELLPKDINENLFQKYLYTSHLQNPDVDLIIRTSGEKRLSGFLLWQSAYSELVFLDVYWPDFRKIDLMLSLIHI